MQRKNQHIITLPLSIVEKNQQRENMQTQYFLACLLRAWLLFSMHLVTMHSNE